MFWRIAQVGTLAFVVVTMVFDPTASVAARLTTRIEFGVDRLEPLAHTKFCGRYPNECASFDPHRIHGVAITRAIMEELETVNQTINQSIIATLKREGGAIKDWLLYPEAGDCTDIAVTKRHDLRARGWPADALLLAEVKLRSTGEHHLVLVARTDTADFVLDNLHSRVRDFSNTLSDYQWLRIQSSANPRFWNSVHIPRG